MGGSRLDPLTERAVSAFMTQVRGLFVVREAWLFGSRARESHAPDSDADIAVVLPGRRSHLFSTVQAMSGVAFDVMLQTGVTVSPLPLWEDEVQRPETYTNPALLENIRREGLPV
jgi:predicted nucleotidyltransferase